MPKIAHGTNMLMAFRDDQGTWRALGTVTNFSRSCAPGSGEVMFRADGYEDLNHEPVSTSYRANNNEEKETMEKLNVYEYVVVLRVTEEQAKAGQKDMLLIGPKVLMGKNKQEIERVAIRAVAAEIDIAMVEVIVRPFVW